VSAQLSLWVEIRFTQIKKESVKETKPTCTLVAARLEFSMCFSNFTALQNKSSLAQCSLHLGSLEISEISNDTLTKSNKVFGFG
jgi:hypothetical protein